MDSIQLKQERDPKYGKYDNPNEEVVSVEKEPIVDTEPMSLVKEEMPENITLEEEEPNQIVDEKPLPPVVPVIRENEPVFQEVTKPKTRRIRRKSSSIKSPTQKKRKRCKKGSRRNRKTKRCRRKCEPGYKKNKSNRCVKVKA
jgi:hypothetical protein